MKYKYKISIPEPKSEMMNDIGILTIVRFFDTCCFSGFGRSNMEKHFEAYAPDFHFRSEEEDIKKLSAFIVYSNNYNSKTEYYELILERVND